MLRNDHTPVVPEPEVLADSKKRAAWVIYQLKLRNQNLSKLARRHKKTRSAAASALRRPYPIWEARIACELGMTPQQLFPERYDKHGIPNRKAGRPSSSARGDKP